MTSRDLTPWQLRQRAEALEAELEQRKSVSERQADLLVNGPTRTDREVEALSFGGTSLKQAAVILGVWPSSVPEERQH